MQNIPRLSELPWAMPAAWFVALLALILAFVLAGGRLDTQADELNQRILAQVDTRVLPLIEQRRIPRPLLVEVSALLGDPELGINYLTLRNAEGIILTSNGNLENFAQFLPVGLARDVRGFLYRASSNDRRHQFTRGRRNIGRMDYGISLLTIAVRAGAGLWVLLLIAGIALFLVVRLFGPARAALAVFGGRDDSLVIGGEADMTRRAAASKPGAGEAGLSDALAQLADGLQAGLVAVDAQGTIAATNQKAQQLLNLGRVRLRSQPVEDAVPFVDTQGQPITSPVLRCLDEGAIHERVMYRARENRPQIFNVRAAPTSVLGSRVAAVMLFWLDQSGAETAAPPVESAVDVQGWRELGPLLAKHTQQPVAIADSNDVIVFVNPAWAQTFAAGAGAQPGDSLADALPKPFAEQPCREAFDWPVKGQRADGSELSGTVSASFAAWGDQPAWMLLLNASQAATGVDELDDPSAQPGHDHLTGLCGYALFTEELQALQAAGESEQMPLILVVIDLVTLKRINREQGRDVGDRVLVETARRLNAGLDGARLTCRLGGDEFALIMPAQADADVSARVCGDAVATCLAEPFRLGPGVLDVAIDIGMSHFFAGDKQAVSELVEQAEAALYASKLAGDHKPRLYSPEMGEVGTGLSERGQTLRRALTAGEIQLQLQPVLESGGGQRVVAAFAELQWHSKGDDAPSLQHQALIEHAQSLGLADALGAWAVRRLAQTHAGWRDMGLAVIPLILPFTVSAIGFEALGRAWSLAARRHRLPPGAVMLRVAQADLEELAGQPVLSGLRLAVSLDTARKPPDAAALLCLDEQLVQSLPEDAKALEASKTLVGLGEQEKRPVLAGPVTNTEQHGVLSALGVAGLYGAHVAEVMSPRALGRLLARRGSVSL